MKSESYELDVGILEFISCLDENLIKTLNVLTLLKILEKSKEDFLITFKKLFSETWEYKILQAIIKSGQPINRFQLSLLLFPSEGKHYKLYRKKDPVYNALTRLVENGILITVKGKSYELFDIRKRYKSIVKLIIS